MQHVFSLLARLASTEVTIVLVGEPGTGKGVLASTVHELSPRAEGPFVECDCGVASDSLLDEGGPFERARGGTLFLRELDGLPLPVQPRLLRALESRRAQTGAGMPSGGRAEVRLMASSTSDLRTRVTAGQFRDDLYLGLASATVAVPALRERLEDLPSLVAQLLGALGRSEVTVQPDVFEALAARSFPGNVRELKNTLACALAFVESDQLEARHLLLSTSRFDGADLERLPLGGQPLELIERAAIKQTLAQMGGVKSRAAQALGIAVSTLYEKLKKYGL
jgi:DNA-binding NtrC family response regulator